MGQLTPNTMVKIRFKRLVISPRYGSCGPGDVVRCDEAFAAHCVKDLNSAEYIFSAPLEKVMSEHNTRRNRSEGAKRRHQTKKRVAKRADTNATRNG